MDTQSICTGINLPAPHELYTAVSSDEVVCFVEESRRTISQILSGEDPRKIIFLRIESITIVEDIEQYCLIIRDLQRKYYREMYFVARVELNRNYVFSGIKSYDHKTFTEEIIKVRKFILLFNRCRVPVSNQMIDSFSNTFILDLLSHQIVSNQNLDCRYAASGQPTPVSISFNDVDGSTINCVVQDIQSEKIFLSMTKMKTVELFRSSGNKNVMVELEFTDGKEYDIFECIPFIKKYKSITKVLVNTSRVDNSVSTIADGGVILLDKNTDKILSVYQNEIREFIFRKKISDIRDEIDDLNTRLSTRIMHNDASEDFDEIYARRVNIGVDIANARYDISPEVYQSMTSEQIYDNITSLDRVDHIMLTSNIDPPLTNYFNSIIKKCRVVQMDVIIRRRQYSNLR